MLEPPSRDREWVAWLAVGLWTALLYATIPFGRAWAGALRREVHPSALPVLALTAVAVGGLWAGRSAWRQRGQLSWPQGLVIVGTAAGFAMLSWRLGPERADALHLVQYGVLAILLFRAFAHRFRDAGVYAVAAVAGATVGVVDEILQWLTPGRYWQLFDVGLNAVAVVGTLAVLGLGLRPTYISGSPGPRSVRVALLLGAVGVFLLAACLQLTPARLLGLADRWPGLEFVRIHEAPLAEYGHRLRIPGVVDFRSRFSGDELERLDSERAAEAAPVLARYRLAGHWEFLRDYSPFSDPFLHELLLHVFSRERRMQLARSAEGVQAREHWTAAYAEQQILERYFPESLATSRWELGAGVREHLERRRDPGVVYESRVSADVITRVGEHGVAVGCAFVIGMLLATAWALGRRSM